MPPAVEVDEGEEVALEPRDGIDGHLNAKSTETDFASLRVGAIHPLTGPVLVKGARAGDLLEVEFVDIVPQRWAFTAIIPGLGFLRDIMTTPFLVHWDIADGWARPRQPPGGGVPRGRGARRRRGAPAPPAAGAHPGGLVHGRLRCRALARTGRRVGPTRGRAA